MSEDLILTTSTGDEEINDAIDRFNDTEDIEEFDDIV